MKVLWIVMVWPEPRSSAAGLRTLDLITCSVKAGHRVEVVSPCQLNEAHEELKALGVTTHHIEANSSEFDAYIKEFAPSVVLFDRFLMEEQFSWRVRQTCPDALRIVDTIDLHALRKLRQRNVERGIPVNIYSRVDLEGEDFSRELSSLYRSDASLIISPYEYDFLSRVIGVPSSMIQLCRYSCGIRASGSAYDQRKHFAMIGNFNHPPNADAVCYLKNSLWPRMKKILQESAQFDVELHIYGSYATSEINRLSDPPNRLYIKGRTVNAIDTLGQYRINLAPLRFGAGIKGKIVDGWAAGTPCITTPIGAEGMHEELPFGGSIEDDDQCFAEKAVLIYLDPQQWKISQQHGIAILDAKYNPILNHEEYLKMLSELVVKRDDIRKNNHVGNLLWYQGHRSTEYFSRWIELKNGLRSVNK